MSANNGAQYTFKLKGVIDNTFNKTKQAVTDLSNKVKDTASKGFNFKIGDSLKNGFSKVGESLGGVTDKLSGMAGEIPIIGDGLASITSKLGPMGLAITATVGALVGIGTHLVGVTKELEAVRKQFSLFVKDSKDLDIVTAKAQSLKQVFGTSEEEIAKAANTISKEFGISAVEATEKLQKALIATNGKLELGDINEFANQIKSIDGNADTLLTTMTTSVQQGLFSNKSLDALKDFGKNIRSGSDQVKELLKTVGKGDVLSKVQKGLISQQDAYKEIYKDFDKYTLKQQQELTTLLGGGGEALGARGIQTLAQMNGSLDDLVEKGGEYAKHNKEALELQEELAKKQLKSSNQIAPLLKKIELFTLKLKIGFQEFLNPIVDWVFEVGKELSRLFEGAGGALEGIKLVLKPIMFSIERTFDGLKKIIQLWVSIQIGMRNFANFLVNTLGKALDWIFGEGTFSKIKDFFTNVIDFVGVKWNQFMELINQGFAMIRKGIEGDFDAAGEAYDKAKQAGKELFSMSKKTFGTTDENSANADANKMGGSDTNTEFKNQTTQNMSNAASGATSEVKNIVLNLGALQNIQQQVINNGGDVKQIQTMLTQALLQIANDVNQTGNN